MKVYHIVLTPVPPPTEVHVVLTLEEAIELQRTVTSLNTNPIKDRLFDELTRELRTLKADGYDMPGAIYL